MVRLRLLRWIRFNFALAFSAVVAGCGGGSSVNPVQPIAVVVSPRAASVVVTTEPQQFSAAVTHDPSNQGVTWDVDGISGGNPTVGTISTAGLYSPPTGPGTHTVTATSVSDNTKTASASIA